MKRLRCTLGLHRWVVDRETPLTVYRHCQDCPKRDIGQVSREFGYEPVDKKYLARPVEEVTDER